MINNGATLIEYQINYPTLNLELQKNNTKTFDYGTLYCYTKECTKGFKVEKISKVTKKGTILTYVPIENDTDFKKYKVMICEMLDEFNTKYYNKLM